MKDTLTLYEFSMLTIGILFAFLALLAGWRLTSMIGYKFSFWKVFIWGLTLPTSIWIAHYFILWSID